MCEEIKQILLNPKWSCSPLFSQMLHISITDTVAAFPEAITHHGDTKMEPWGLKNVSLTVSFSSFSLSHSVFLISTSQWMFPPGQLFFLTIHRHIYFLKQSNKKEGFQWDHGFTDCWQWWEVDVIVQSLSPPLGSVFDRADPLWTRTVESVFWMDLNCVSPCLLMCCFEI